MATTKERRRNMRAEGCRACGKFCEAGQGYLYRDTNSKTTRRNGRFGWFVKCEECNSGNKTRMTVAMEKQAEKHKDDPVIRPWSVSQVKKWTVELGTVEEAFADVVTLDVGIYVVGSFGRTLISYRDPIGSTFTAPGDMEGYEVDGKPLSKAAAVELSARIYPLVREVNQKETDGVVAAATALTNGGVEVVKHPYSKHWSLKLGGLVTLDAGFQAVAVELTLTGDALTGYRISGYDRRSGVSKWVVLSIADVIAMNQ